jgi:hypothetical protein
VPFLLFWESCSHLIHSLCTEYDGDKWDNFYEKIPISLLHHTNGNAIYNTSHPLLERLVGQVCIVYFKEAFVYDVLLY